MMRIKLNFFFFFEGVLLLCGVVSHENAATLMPLRPFFRDAARGLSSRWGGWGTHEVAMRATRPPLGGKILEITGKLGRIISACMKILGSVSMAIRLATSSGSRSSDG